VTDLASAAPCPHYAGALTACKITESTIDENLHAIHGFLVTIVTIVTISCLGGADQKGSEKYLEHANQYLDYPYPPIGQNVFPCPPNVKSSSSSNFRHIFLRKCRAARVIRRASCGRASRKRWCRFISIPTS